MAERTLVEALNEALVEALAADPDVVVLGEDVGRLGGVFRVTRGLRERFGAERVVDTPLSESGLVGTAIGMALLGMKPVVEIQFGDFVYPAVDQLVNEAAKYRYRTGGEWTVPLVVRMPVGGGIRGGHFHSQTPESLFAHVAGLKVVHPATPRDAKGLLLAAIDDPDPVVFLEPKRVYRAIRDEVPEGAYRIPIGSAAVVRPGTDVTCIAWGAMLYEALAAAERAAAEGVEVEVIDLRTLVPFDEETLARSVEKTGRLVVVHEAPLTCGFGAELVATLTNRCFLRLAAPPARVAGFDTPFPFTHEREYLPLAHRIHHALLGSARY